MFVTPPGVMGSSTFHARTGLHQTPLTLPLTCIVVLAILLWRSTSFCAVVFALVLLPISALPNPPRFFSHFLLLLTWLYIALLLLGVKADSRVLGKALQIVDVRHTGQALQLDVRTKDCSLSRNNISKALDVYFVAHFVGFAVKALIVDDRRVLWLSGALFELFEYSLAAVFPEIFGNLAECVWDRFVLDLAFSNFLGMEVGFIVGRRTMRSAKWIGPHVLLAAAFIVGVDISSFLIKAALHIDTYSPLHIARLIFITTASFPAIRQYDLWCHGAPLGPHATSLVVTVFAELTLAIAQLSR